MLENTSRNRRLLAGVVGVNLALALAVSAGAVPRPGDGGPVRTASVPQVEEVAAPIRQPGDTAVDAAPAPVPTSAEVPVATSSAVAAPKATAPPTTKAPVVAVSKTTRSTTPAPAATVAPVATTAPAAPVKVARRTPTAAEVQAAITELRRQVGGVLRYVSPTPDQLAQAGDEVCTAFDNGQSFAQVKATGLSMIPASVTVTPATVDWAVRQGVSLYCPGHADKLV